MYGLEQNVDLGFFIGRTLLQACFGVHDLILNFDEDVCVTVTSSLGISDNNGQLRICDDFRQAASVILAQLNRTVLTVNGEPNGTLTLVFDGGERLAFYDDSDKYESYVIQFGKRIVVV
ncbi:MAG: hypothetical protein RBU24_00170 [Kiritimatiellia bacterium]|nr:hypothetical protein [Kiritimatiellia bacterium]